MNEWDIKLGAKIPCKKCGLPIRPGTRCPMCEPTFGVSVEEWRKREEEERERINKMGTWPSEVYFG